MSSKLRRGMVVSGLIALAAYAFLKAAWGLGSEVGIEDGAEFDRLFGSLTGFQFWLATWGTVLAALAGAILLLLVAADDRTLFGRSALRGLLRGCAWSISAVLGAGAAVALVATAISCGPSPFADWVSYLTYGSFLLYAVSLGYVLGATRRILE